ncbi:MAG: 3-hydroxyacyl-ACP dehydratase FabZ [Acidimicrobiia bacterium]|nr:3-hydroxyacyl-ACP dehydratase FabZ [Acidimicrobiia bacterium]
MALIDIAGIRRLLPHRYPMLLVDQIVLLEDDRVVAIKGVTANEPFFQGHFPEYPVMPGVLIVEAMAQAAGVLVLGKIPDRENKQVFLAGVDAARFRRQVVPGDLLRMEVKLVHGRPTRAKMEGKAYVGETLVAEATFLCVLQDKAAGGA